MKPAKRNTGQVVQSMKDQLNSLYATIIAGGIAVVVIIVLLFAVTALPLTALIIGSIKINNCTIQSMIPIWLIVIGVTGIAMTGLQITLLICRVWCCKKTDSNDETSAWISIMSCFFCIISLFSFAWLIAGCVWIFSVKPTVEFTDPTSTNYCDSSAYNYAFGLVIAQLCMIGVCGCCVPCIVAIIVPFLK